MLCSDACKYWIGGYNDKGVAWCWYIPPELYGVLTMNLLEFLASEVSIYMTIQQLGHRSHILSFTGISSALRWMHEASFDPVNKGGHDTVAQWLGCTLVSNEASLYSQHIKVTKNIIVDSHSRDFNISYQSLTQHFSSILTPQIAASFHIKLPPREIISCILSLESSSTRPR